jgi:hypothetical protein
VKEVKEGASCSLGLLSPSHPLPLGTLDCRATPPHTLQEVPSLLILDLTVFLAVHMGQKYIVHLQRDLFLPCELIKTLGAYVQLLPRDIFFSQMRTAAELPNCQSNWKQQQTHIEKQSLLFTFQTFKFVLNQKQCICIIKISIEKQSLPTTLPLIPSSCQWFSLGAVASKCFYWVFLFAGGYFHVNTL